MQIIQYNVKGISKLHNTLSKRISKFPSWTKVKAPSSFIHLHTLHSTLSSNMSTRKVAFVSFSKERTAAVVTQWKSFAGKDLFLVNKFPEYLLFSGILRTAYLLCIGLVVDESCLVLGEGLELIHKLVYELPQPLVRQLQGHRLRRIWTCRHCSIHLWHCRF